MTTEHTLIEFPCEFPIKIIGKNSLGFKQEIINIIHKHFPKTPEASILIKQSKQDNYLAISVTVYVTSQKTLDGLYLDLTKHPDIKMVL